MGCSDCGHENPATAKFCVECGAALARSCNTCGTELATNAKFCMECGASTNHPATATPEQHPNAVRKRVTALFADLVGSTAFAERVDPEAARATMAPYFEMLQSTIEDHAGTVVKFMGDGMLALFGVPEVAEDDALRAVSAGLELQRRFVAFADDVRERHSVALGLRIGVNTGELVVGDDDADLVGDVLNTAARLEAACEAGRVLVGEDTWRLTRSHTTFEALTEVRVKGKAEPVMAFQAVCDGTAVGDDAAPFVGRVDELDVLRAVFDDVVAGSTARLVTLVGAPGVGKTRLAQELRSVAGVRSFDVRFERRGSTTFSPIADVLREVTGSASVESIDELLHDHPEAERLGPVLSSLVGHGGPRTTEESFWAVRRLLELLASAGPVVFVVDDVQWAEPLFWDLLEHLVEWVEAPVLLLALARPELRELRPELTQPGRRLSAAISLEGLDRETTLELAARLLDIDVLPDELADRLPESTDGNPLFVRELVQMLVDDGVLVRDGDRWRLTIEAEAIEVPPTILSLLASRVERLPDDERQVVELAGVVGTEFDRGTLAAIAPADITGRLGALIDRLRRKDLIEPSGQWAGDHPVFRFHHVLIRDAAYRRLLKARRAELHERVGRHVALSATADDTNAERNVVVAFHFEQVHRYRSELGTVDGHVRELAAEAAIRLQSAADDALGREDLPSAGAYAIRALALVDVDAGGVRDDLLVLGCEALLSSGDVSRGAPLVDELHERSTDERLAAWADCFRAQLWSLTDANRVTEAADLTAVVADRLAALGDAAGVAKARLVRASCLARLGRVGDCEAELDLALGAARSAGDRRRTVAVLGAAPLASLWGPSPVARAGGRCLDVLRLLRITAPSPTVEATSIRCQGMLEALRGRFDSARTKFEASRAIARDLGLRHGLFETELFAGYAELLADDAAAAEPHLRAASEGLGRLGIGADAEQAGALLARSLLLQGRTEEADVLATHALDTAGQNLQTAITSRAVLAEVRAAQGRHDEARTLVDEAISVVAPTDVTLDHALTLLAAARVAAAADDASAERRHRARAVELLEAKGVSLEFGESGHDVELGDQTASVEQRPRPIWNEAIEAAVRAAAAANDRDRDHFVECFQHDFTSVDRGALADAAGFDGRIGAEGWADFMLFVMAQSEGSVVEIEPTAIRGESHALVRQILQSPTSSLQRLAVFACVDGKLATSTWYDAEQLTDALEQLDRDFLVSQGLPHDHWIVRNWHRAYATRPEDMLPIMHPELAFHDRRRLVSRGGGLVDLLAGADAGLWATEASIPRVVRASERGAVYERVETTAGNPGEIRNLLVLGFADERIRWIDVFDAHDPEDDQRAIGRYDELATGRRSVSNRAAELTGALMAAHVAGDTATIERLMPSDARIEHRRRLALAADGDGSGFRAYLTADRALAGEVRGAITVRAIRAEHLCVVETELDHGDGPQRDTVVVECEADRIVALVRFDDDRIDDAIAELDRRWLATCGVPTHESIVRNWHYSRTNRMSDLAEIAHPDFEYTNHQRFRTGSGGDIDELVRRGWEETEVLAVITEVHRFDRTGAIYERSEIRDDDEISRVVVLELLDDLIKSFDIFDTEDLDEALALFDGRRSTAPPRTSDDSQHSNRAAELMAALMAAHVAGDTATIEQLLPPDARMENRRRLALAADGDGRGFRAYLTADRALGEVRGDITVRAIRAAHLCVVETELDHGDLPHRDIVVVESDDANIVCLTWFDADQLDHAIAELDRRYRLSCGIDDDHWITRNWHVLYSVDFDDMEPLLHPDFEYVERRQLAWPDGGAGDWREWFRDRDLMEVTLPAMYRLCEHGLVTVRRERVEAGDLGVVEVVLVNEVEDERVRRVVSYSPDHLDAALAAFDAFVARRTTRTLTNSASELAMATAIAWQARDRERFASLLTDDFVGATFDPTMMAIFGELDLSTTDYLGVIFADDLAGAIDIELIALRGDSLCLQQTRITSPSGDLTERLVLCEVRDGRVAGLYHFAPDHLLAAQAELDRRYRRSCGIDDDHWVARFWNTLTSFDADAYEEILAEDVRSFDHRALHLSDVGRDEFLAWLRATSSEVSWSVPAIHRLSPRGVVYEQHESRADEAASSRLLLVVEFGERRCQRVDAYEPHDLDAALARYHELMREESGSGLTNAARELAEAAADAWRARDRERYASLLADDFVAGTSDRLRVSVDGELGADDFLDAIFADDLVGSIEIEPIAIRGDRLCLQLTQITSPAGDLTERLMLAETRDGRIARWDYFTGDQLRAAQLELDRRWLSSIGFDDDDFLFRHWRRSYSMDPDEFSDLLHPDFEFVDHSLLAFPSGDAHTLATVMGSAEHHVAVTVPRIHRISQHGGVVERIERATGDLFGERHFVTVFQVADDALRRMDVFTLEDLEAAIALFDERERTTHTHRVENRASVLALAASAAQQAGDRERFASYLADDFVAVAHDPILATVGEGGVFDRDTYLAGAFDPLVFGRDSVYELEMIAVRGDDLCLFRVRTTTGQGDVYERLNLVEVRDGLAVRNEVFPHDHLAEAQIALDDRWLDGLGYADDHFLRRISAASYTVDPAAFASMMHPDVEYVEHRRFSFTGGDGTALFEAMQTVAHEVEVTAPVFYRLNDRGAVALRVEIVQGEVAENRIIAVMGFQDGLYRHVELFDEGDLDVALARYDEIVGSTSVVRAAVPLQDDLVVIADAVDRSLRNEASSLGDRMHELLTTRDREGLARIIHDDFVGHSARRFRTMDSFSFDEFAQQWFAVYDTEGTPTGTTSTVLAVRGDTLALVDVAGEFGDAVNSSLALARSADGKLAELWFFDPDSLHDALDLLNELWSPDEMEPIQADVESRYRRVFASGTVDDFRALVTDDFEFRDHRKLGLGVRDLDEYLASSSDFFGCSQMIITEVIDWSGPVVLLRASFRLPGDDQIADPQLLSVTVIRDGRLAVQEPFDPDDLAAAHARFDELVAEFAGSRSPASGSRAADIIAAQASARWAKLAVEINQSLHDRGSLLAFRDRFHPDFVGRWASTLFAVLEDADLDEFLEVTANVIDMGQRLELTISEARHDRLALGAYTIRTDDDVAERLIVMRLDDGLLREFVVFDQADADAARAELDRQWRTMSDAEASAGSTSGSPQLTAPGDRSRAQFSELATEFAPEVPAGAERSSARGDDSAGDDSAGDDSAGTDFDASDGPSPKGEHPTLHNLAVDLARRAQRALTDGNYAELRRWSTDDFAIRIERRANPYRSGDLDTYIDGLRSTAELGLVPVEWRPVAVRGEQLALVRCDMVVPTTGDTLGILALVEVDGAGRGVGVVEYEPEDLDIALRELDQRWEQPRNARIVGR